VGITSSGISSLSLARSGYKEFNKASSSLTLAIASSRSLPLPCDNVAFPTI